ncbi:phosphomannomutase/phosphoglucomutase ManB [Thermacetogenium phaeum DSM 12270]|uniref:Phosphomannomutase/phosphoglucomutase ManB n=1 Tax=Thermacetogenium phaeum (strain ATCC BAA-254 / DSM 26808 / PB) TaxID=1089553 RepID=K4LJ93_THEPS|nr:phosphomannomutase/phosphoglucomutase [Thermacetogenium phaeum]AFV13071.1 phosphomannomutase/phosphoglucomutase ManB [Thermacetogenium phaeum DSM 12270]
MNADIFRQYDIRGHAERDLTDETVRLIGRAFGSYVLEHGKKDVLVGRDNRLSSPRIHHALLNGLLSTGCRVIDIGTVVTPILYFAREHWQVEGGVMITGSHNPPEENGFKLACGPGTIYGKEITHLREMISRGEFRSGAGTLDSKDAAGPYIEMLNEKIRLGPRKLKVAVDCGNGTASLFAERILQNWGCEVIPLYCSSDGTFPNHHPDPVKTANLTALKSVVLEENADLGVAYDGDADRIGVVDDRGNVVWGDRLMCLFWREILPRHPGALAIIEVKCSQALVDEVRRLGGKPVFYKTGHSLIKAKMRETGAVFTGEMSGHMFFADEYYGYDDAFYATGRLLRILSHTEKSLSQLLADIPHYYATAETRIPCPDKAKFSVVSRLVERFRREYEIIDVDGVRVIFPDGWGLVRASNTQPVLVARCESRTPEGLRRICTIMKDAIGQNEEVGEFEWEF